MISSRTRQDIVNAAVKALKEKQDDEERPTVLRLANSIYSTHFGHAGALIEETLGIPVGWVNRGTSLSVTLEDDDSVGLDLAEPRPMPLAGCTVRVYPNEPVYPELEKLVSTRVAARSARARLRTELTTLIGQYKSISSLLVNWPDGAQFVNPAAEVQEVGFDEINKMLRSG